MAIRFRQAGGPGLEPLDGTVYPASIVGLTGGDPGAIDTLCQLASAERQPDSGAVERDGDTLVLRHPMEGLDAFERVRRRMEIEAARRNGAAILVLTHDDETLRLCDEVWWLEEGRLAGRGAPGVVLESYRRHVNHRLREWARDTDQPLHWTMRRGDDRARIVELRTLDAEGHPSAVLRSGEPASVRVRVRFEQDVADPVVGIMVRTRVGFEVYGTNTELERLKLGPVAAGTELEVRFDFTCALCPQDYTLTAASHDPDGVWHDWMEDAVAFTVVDTRYTAGVANLGARVSTTSVTGP
jgi:lipopolysaccharide transport system ATP-binding protein